MADTNTPQKPTHDICFVIEREGKKSIWLDLGAAWAHKDGAGMNLNFQTFPTDFKAGRIVVRLRTPKQDGETA